MGPASNPDPLDLIKAHVIVAPAIEPVVFAFECPAMRCATF
jgi:hypothetical protein